ncbi:MAG: sensor domain-containing diguanylate cyclase [Candidatus Cryosericum sp.]
MSAVSCTGVIELHELQSVLQERSYRKALQRAAETISRAVLSSSITIMTVGVKRTVHFEAWAAIDAAVVRSAEKSFNRQGLPANLADVIRTRKLSVIEDLSTYAEWRDPVPSYASWAGFPILQHGRVIGIINVQTLKERITPEVIAVIEPVVSTIALIILRYEEARELALRNRHQRVLYEMAIAGTRQQEMGEMLQRVLKLISSIIGNRYLDILVYDAQREALVLMANRGHDVERIGLELSVLTSKGVTVRAFHTQKPVIVRDTRKSRNFVQGQWPARSELAVPLVAQGSCIGVLNIESLRVGAFTRSDIHELLPFTSGLALLIDNQQKARQLREQASRDGLTGLFNRRMMDEMIPRELQRSVRYHRDMSLAMLDLDGFKAVNDTLGHKEGDRLLRVFAGCIRKVVRAADFMYRYGGDEFLILMPETSVEQAEEVLERLNATTCPELSTTLGNVTFSAGIASYLADSSSEDLVSLADQRLYQSKRLGKGHITSR